MINYIIFIYLYKLILSQKVLMYNHYMFFKDINLFDNIMHIVYKQIMKLEKENKDLIKNIINNDINIKNNNLSRVKRSSR